MKEHNFTSVKFMRKEEKEKVLKDWKSFIESGFSYRVFTKRIYEHLTLHCMFIAHYSKDGFYSTYFVDPEDTLKFLRQFDKDSNFKSIEYGSDIWLKGEYGDRSLRCGICGRSMSASTKQCVKKKGGKEYGPYLQQYYYCFGRMLKKGCLMRWVRKDRLDPLVWNKIKEIVKNPALIRKAIIEKEKRSGPTNAALKKDIKGIDKKIKDCESERQKILRIYRKGIIGEGDFVNQIKELQEEKDALDQQRKEIELRIESQVYIEDSLKSLENFARKSQERIDNLNFEERRELIKLLVRRVIVKEDGGVVDVEVIVPQVDSQPGGKGESHKKQPTCFPSIAQLRHISW